MKPKLDLVHEKLTEIDGQKKHYPDFPESTPLMITGIYRLNQATKERPRSPP